MYAHRFKSIGKEHSSHKQYRSSCWSYCPSISHPVFLSAHLRSVAMRKLIEHSLMVGGAGSAWLPFPPDCGRVMKMVHFGDNKLTDPCHCPDQTLGVGGEIRWSALRNSLTVLCPGHDLILTHFNKIWIEILQFKKHFPVPTFLIHAFLDWIYLLNYNYMLGDYYSKDFHLAYTGLKLPFDIFYYVT